MRIMAVMVKKYFVRFFGAAGTLVQWACITHCVFEYIGDFVVCTGPSMEPTIFSNDILLTEHITPRFRKLKKGDIVIAKNSTKPSEHICKRIKAVEGEKVRHGFTTYIIPEGHIWLEGDNSSNSTDSRQYGPVPRGLVRTRAICKVWPPRDIALLTTKCVNPD